MNDLVVVAGLTVAACAGVGAFGAWLLSRTRHVSLRYQLGIATVLPVLAVAAAVLINVQLMFLSAHDTTVILIALGLALGLALAGCWLITRRLGRASRQLERNVGLLVRDGTGGEDPRSEQAAPPPAAALPAELARVERELAEARRTLAESRAREAAAEQSRRELVSFLSHDLRTPLAGLRALSEGLEDGVITDVPEALGRLRSTVVRVNGMVDDLFALSRVQTQPDPPQPRLLSVSELVLDVVGEAAATAGVIGEAPPTAGVGEAAATAGVIGEAAARAAGVTLDAEVPDGDRLAVLGRHEDLHRALANLVSNAIRHTPPGHRVLVSAGRAEDGTIRVAVGDGCGGIPESHLDRVFDAGWRGSPDRGDGGAGLGLAIARGVVRSHRGEIAVRNVGPGCCFELSLPPADSQPEVS